MSFFRVATDIDYLEWHTKMFFFLSPLTKKKKKKNPLILKKSFCAQLFVCNTYVCVCAWVHIRDNHKGWVCMCAWLCACVRYNAYFEDICKLYEIIFIILNMNARIQDKCPNSRLNFVKVMKNFGEIKRTLEKLRKTLEKLKKILEKYRKTFENCLKNIDNKFLMFSHSSTLRPHFG